MERRARLRSGVPASPAPPRAQLLLAFAIVYVVWGSTYLAMRVAIDTLPPFLMGGVRFVIAGALLAAWVAVRERPGWPTRGQWLWALATGALLMVGGNGGVLLAETRVPSGVVALLAASLAIWMVVLDGLRPEGPRQPPLVWVGLAVGLAGVGVLVGPARLAGAGTVDPIGAAFALGGSLAWAAGSLLSRGRGRPESALAGSALQMLCGGALLLLLAAAHGDFTHVAGPAGAPSARSLAAVAYLVVFGSLVGFTAYVWLLQHAAPAKVATYAYVNPLVAVALGWALGGEPLGARTLVAAAVIVGGVALITAGRARA